MNQLLDEVLRAHGGRDQWARHSTVNARLTFGGLAFNVKFNNAGLIDRTAIVAIREPRVILEGFPKEGCRGHFTPNKVWIEQEDHNIASRTFPREAFKTIKHLLYWDDLDLLYFAGYALWNYLNSPFLLEYNGVEVRKLEDWTENGERWHRLKATFPKTFPTHCLDQVFYFDQSYHMVRLDYCPEVFASWARAAHYCRDYQTCDGIRIPMSRRVVPNNQHNRPLSFPTLVWIKIKKVNLS